MLNFRTCTCSFGCAFIFNWLSCQMDPHDITNPSQNYSFVRLCNSTKGGKIKGKKFHTQKKKRMRELNINQICLPKYHVVLRRKKSNIPILMGYETRTQGKFFRFLVTSSNVILLFSKSLM